MKGSIQKKGKIFYAVVAVNGKRRWHTGGDTKKDTQKLPEIDQGTYRDLKKATFKAFSDLWLKSYAEPSVKPIYGHCLMMPILTGSVLIY